MPFSAPHYLLTFGGKYGATEQWTCSFRLQGGAQPATQAAELATAGEIGGVLRTKWALATNPVGNSAGLSWVKYNRIGIDGKYVNNWSTTVDFTEVLSGTQGPYPFQIALVATLRTRAARGPASAGRIFLPCPKYPIDGADRRISTANALQAAAWTADLINGINGIASVGSVSVMSAVGAGAAQSVVKVDVGTVLDTMRSRRSNLIEQRQVSDVVGQAGGDDF